jgi:hypothetical protein
MAPRHRRVNYDQRRVDSTRHIFDTPRHYRVTSRHRRVQLLFAATNTVYYTDLYGGDPRFSATENSSPKLATTRLFRLWVSIQKSLQKVILSVTVRN